MSGGDPRFRFLVPIYAPGKEPLPPGYTEEDRESMAQMKKYQTIAEQVQESCLTKAAISGAVGFGIGGFFSLMTTSFQYEDPLLRQQASIGASQKFSVIMRDMAKGVYTNGKSFGKIGALFQGIECVIEGYRAKNDIYNSVASGFFTGGILARNSGPKGTIAGALGFAAFSAAIDMFMRREPSDDD